MPSINNCICCFYSLALHHSSPESTYAFGDAGPYQSNFAGRHSKPVRESIVNIWWQGDLGQIEQDVKRTFPDAYFVGYMTDDLHLRWPSDPKPIPARRWGLPAFERNGPMPCSQSSRFHDMFRLNDISGSQGLVMRPSVHVGTIEKQITTPTSPEGKVVSLDARRTVRRPELKNTP